MKNVNKEVSFKSYQTACKSPFRKGGLFWIPSFVGEKTQFPPLVKLSCAYT